MFSAMIDRFRGIIPIAMTVGTPSRTNNDLESLDRHQLQRQPSLRGEGLMG